MKVTPWYRLFVLLSLIVLSPFVTSPPPVHSQAAAGSGSGELILAQVKRQLHQCGRVFPNPVVWGTACALRTCLDRRRCQATAHRPLKSVCEMAR